MRSFKHLNILFFFLFVFEMASCQRFKYAPGYDFELFRNTPAYYLAKAVELEDTEAITKFIGKGSVPVDFKESKFGNTLLLLAIVNSKNLSAKRLLELGANPNSRSLNDSNPLLSACSNIFDLRNPREALLLLIKNGADVNAVQLDTTYDQFGNRKHYSTTPLASLCIHGNLESVKILVEHGASLTIYGSNEDAILSTAVLSGKLDILKYLLIEKKAPIPDYVVIRQPGNKSERKMTITDMLNENNSGNMPDSSEDKQEILSYLKKLGRQ